MTVDAFFHLYAGLDREGPGTADDVTWASGIARVGPGARVADLGCGSGGDIAALLTTVPEGHVTAIDAHAPFVDRIAARFTNDGRVSARVGSMAEPGGPYDFIWCAGAAYFLGVSEALTAWRAALAPGAAVAFSEPCLFTENPGDAARRFWAEYPDITDEAGIRGRIAAAGYRVLATRPVARAGWDAYYRSLSARCAALKPGADADLAGVITAAECEIADFDAQWPESGYLLAVVHPA